MEAGSRSRDYWRYNAVAFVKSSRSSTFCYAGKSEKGSCQATSFARQPINKQFGLTTVFGECPTRLGLMHLSDRGTSFPGLLSHCVDLPF